MKKPVLYLQRDEGPWTVVHPGRQLRVVAAGDVKLEDALRIESAPDTYEEKASPFPLAS